MARPKLRSTTNPKLAIAYMRISTTDQTVDPQRDAIERWASSHGITVVAWCSDEGVSGAAPLDERPALLEALGLLRQHGAGLLVAAKRCRVARDVSTAAAVERLTAEAGSRLQTADGLDSSDSPEGRLLRTLIDAIAQYERALIRARTKAALGAKAKRGEVVGGIPLGCKAQGGMLVKDHAEQQALERMRRLHAAGTSHASIAHVLTQEGYAPRGKRWHVTTVTRALARKVCNLEDTPTPPPTLPERPVAYTGDRGPADGVKVRVLPCAPGGSPALSRCGEQANPDQHECDEKK